MGLSSNNLAFGMTFWNQMDSQLNARAPSPPLLGTNFDMTYPSAIEETLEFLDFPGDVSGEVCGQTAEVVGNESAWVAPTQVLHIHISPTLFTEMRGSYISIFPPVEQNLWRSQAIQNALSGLPYERYYHQNTAKLIRSQSIEVQLNHFLLFYLINEGDVMRMLYDPTTATEKVLKAGVEYLLSLNPHLLGKILDSIPVPYRRAFEQTLFCVGLDTGSRQTVETFLQRGFDPNRHFSLSHSTFHRSTPLEHSIARSHFEITRVLVEYGADPRTLHANPSWNWTLCNSTSPDAPEILSLLIAKGAGFKFSLKLVQGFDLVFKSCESGILNILVDILVNSASDWSVLKKALAFITRRQPDLSKFAAIKNILQHPYAEIARSTKGWKSDLTLLLVNAAEMGNDEAINLLLDAGAIPNNTCLFTAVRSEKLEIVERFLGFGLSPNVIDLDDNYCEQYLNSSLSVNCAIAESVRLIFKEAFRSFERDGWLSKAAENAEVFGSILEAASSVGDFDLVDHLLSLYPHHLAACSYKVLDSAIRMGREAFVRKLLAANFVPGHASLLATIENKNTALTELLIELGDYWHPPQLMLEAVLWGSSSVIRKLLRSGYQLNTPTTLGNDYEGFKALAARKFQPYDWNVTPLGAAILEGKLEIIQLLLVHGASVNCQTGKDFPWRQTVYLTPLATCVIKKDLALTRRLLSIGADPFDNLAVYIAAILEERDLLVELLSAFIQRCGRETRLFGAHALMWAVSSNIRWMMELIVRPADVNHLIESEHPVFNVPSSRSSPLAMAIMVDSKCMGFSEVLPLLLQNGGDPNGIVCDNLEEYKDRSRNDRKTALLYAIELGSLETVAKLHNAGADLAFPASGRIKRTPLQAAAEAGNGDILNYLLGQGVDVNEASALGGGATALQLAAIKGFVGIATSLLEAGANVNSEPAFHQGRTAFEGATEHGRLEMMLFLVKNGADLLSNDLQQYRRAVEFAKRNGKYAAIELADELLKEAIKNRTSTLDDIVEPGVPDVAESTHQFEGSDAWVDLTNLEQVIGGGSSMMDWTDFLAQDVIS